MCSRHHKYDELPSSPPVGQEFTQTRRARVTTCGSTRVHSKFPEPKDVALAFADVGHSQKTPPGPWVQRHERIIGGKQDTLCANDVDGLSSAALTPESAGRHLPVILYPLPRVADSRRPRCAISRRLTAARCAERRIEIARLAYAPRRLALWRDGDVDAGGGGRRYEGEGIHR